MQIKLGEDSASLSAVAGSAGFLAYISSSRTWISKKSKSIASMKLSW